MLHLEKSAAAFAEAQTLMPGGVNSPVRSYNRIGCPPPFIAWAKGSTICDIHFHLPVHQESPRWQHPQP